MSTETKTILARGEFREIKLGCLCKIPCKKLILTSHQLDQLDEKEADNYILHCFKCLRELTTDAKSDEEFFLCIQCKRKAPTCVKCGEFGAEPLLTRTWSDKCIDCKEE